MSFSSSSSTPAPKSDVFLSFSEKDAKTFASDLSLSFSENGITMKDDVLQKGASSSLGSDQRSEGIIRESKLAVVIVSKSYTTSTRCLNELQTIVRLYDEGCISILPIFYGVDETVVRRQTKELAEPFRKFGEEYPSEKVQSWRISLIKLTNISGSPNSRNLMDDGWMVETITSQVMRVLADKRVNLRPTITRPVSDKKIESLPTKTLGLVGLDRPMLALQEMLDLKSNEEVRFIGICGHGGVGKTTLAKHVYEELRNSFHAHVFVDNAVKICQQATDHESEGDQRSLLSVIKSTVSHRRSLLVFDCVDNIKQIKDIAEIVGLCCPGSRVILVTQDKKLLDEFGVEHVYEVQPLRYDEALQVFSQYAFNQQHPPASFELLSIRAVRIAGFLPLSLKILGSSLQGKDGEFWRKELQKLEGSQEKAIRQVMMKIFIKDNGAAFIFPLKL